MGSSDSDASEDEKPRHLVRITQAFYLGATEVTQGQRRSVMGSEPWKGATYTRQGKEYPATMLSWNDAQAFCRKLGVTEGASYRLPTEAEWEYACRSGTTTRYSFGDDEAALSDYAWWGGIVGNGNAKSEKFFHEVALKKPNAWGLYDLHGNVWEWCQDRYATDYYAHFAADAAVDPRGPSSSSGERRVLRGGAWNDYPGYLRCADRLTSAPDYRNQFIGFRVVCARAARSL